jgi:alpha-L-fucosidase
MPGAVVEPGQPLWSEPALMSFFRNFETRPPYRENGENMKLVLFPLAALLAGSCLFPANAAVDTKSFEYRFDDSLTQTPDSMARMNQWYCDAKFGAFIHFGVYSVLGGAYKGSVPGQNYAEWIEVNARMSTAEYHDVAKGFNPVDFDADAWVKVFKENGMKYVVITSKHHDGFALFDSAASDFNMVKATPFKRDIIKELCDACHREGLKFGVYYSQAQDWDNPDAPYLNPRRSKRNILHPGLPADFKPDFDRYIREKSLPQVEELMKNYAIDLIWFDTPAGMTFERAKLFTDVIRKYRPDCLINSRLIMGGKDKVLQKNLELFDYISLGDKEVPDRKLSLYVESPDSVSTSYGYKNQGKQSYHSAEELIQRLVHTVCAGGNYLLNNGPMGNGKLDPEAVRLYRAIGEWLKVNGESIYGTCGNPLPSRPAWGDCSVSQDGKTLYLHVMSWPESGTLTVDGLSAPATSVVLLANGQPVEFEPQGNTVNLTLPAAPLNKYDTVVKVTL